ncbi:MAG: LysE family transporter [Bacteroidales bacterium]|nr:LysE family transporter [Bacteroidales bacterium]
MDLASSLILFLVKGIVIGFLASIPLGPIGVLCIQRTLSRGRRSGFASGLGAASSDFIYAIIAGFSVSMVMEFVQEQQKILTILGAIILIGLGLKIYFTNPVVQMRRQRLKRSSGMWHDYISTFLLTITNPLAIFLFLGAFSVVGSETTIYLQCAMLSGVFVGAASWWFVLTMLVGIFRKKFTIKRIYYLNKIAGSCIIAIVLVTLIVEFFRNIFS